MVTHTKTSQTYGLWGYVATGLEVQVVEIAELLPKQANTSIDKELTTSDTRRVEIGGKKPHTLMYDLDGHAHARWKSLLGTITRPYPTIREIFVTEGKERTLNRQQGLCFYFGRMTEREIEHFLNSLDMLIKSYD